jgi:hypothetical protein
MPDKLKRPAVRRRFRTRGEHGYPQPPFAEKDHLRLVGRAMTFMWWERVRLGEGAFDVRAPFVEALGPDADTWTMAGRFLAADLLGGFTPDRYGRLMSCAAQILDRAKRLAELRTIRV